jgi:hypothetical protein
MAVWPLAMLMFSTIVTALYFSRGCPQSLAKLALISWGATIMFIVDIAFALLEGEEPIEISVDAILLSFTLVVATIALWLIGLFITKRSKH